MAKRNTWFFKVKESGSKKAGANIKNLNGKMNNLSSTVKKLAVGMGALYLGKSLIGAAKSALETAGEFESLRVRLDVMYGSVQRGGEAFQVFNDVAATTPYLLKSVVEAGASLKSFGVDAEKMAKPVADLAARMGIDIVDAASAFGRAFVGGAGAADVLKDKGILPLIAATQGISDLTKLTLPEFREAMEKTFLDPTAGIAGMTEKMSKTWMGTVSNFKDGVDRIKNAIGIELIKAIQPMILRINKEMARMGEIGWDNIGKSMMENWKIILTALGDIGKIGGKLIGMMLADGIKKTFEIGWDSIKKNIGKSILDFAVIISGANYANMISQLIKGQKKVTKQQKTHNNEYDKLLKELENILDKTNKTIIEKAEEFKKEKDDADAKIAAAQAAANKKLEDQNKNKIDNEEETKNKLITIQDVQLKAIIDGINKQAYEYKVAGVGIVELTLWKFREIMKATAEFAANLEETQIQAESMNDYALAKLSNSLDEEIKLYKDANVNIIELEEYKARRLAELRNEQNLQKEYDSIIADGIDDYYLQRKIISSGEEMKVLLDHGAGTLEVWLHYLRQIENFQEEQRISRMEETLVAKDDDDLAFQEFKVGLERRIGRMRKAQIDEDTIREWKSNQIAKYNKQDAESQLQATSQILGSMASLNENLKGSAKVTAGIQMVQATVDAFSAANSSIASPPKGYGTTPIGWAMYAAALASGLGNVVAIGQSMKSLAEGGSFVTSGAETIRVGDNPSGRERVTVTPLDSVGDPTAGGGGVNITFTGNVMSEEFIENEAIPQIKEAIRRGADIGIG